MRLERLRKQQRIIHRRCSSRYSFICGGSFSSHSPELQQVQSWQRKSKRESHKEERAVLSKHRLELNTQIRYLEISNMKILPTGIKKGGRKNKNEKLASASETKEILRLTQVPNYCNSCICLGFFISLINTLQLQSSEVICWPANLGVATTCLQPVIRQQKAGDPEEPDFTS